MSQEDDGKVETVCGGRTTLTRDTPRAEYRGETVYFCTRACLRAFLQAPDPFMGGEVEHPDDE